MERQGGRRRPEPEISQEWQDYFDWSNSLSREEKGGGAHGEWPEGTPETYIELEKRLTVEERFLMAIFGEQMPSFEEILSRPEDYLARREEEQEQRHRIRMARAVGEPTNTELSNEELQAQYREMYPRGLQDEVEKVLNALTEQERKVLRLRFGLDDGRSRTQDQVGQEIGRSVSTVRRLEKRGLIKLRAPSIKNTLSIS